MQYRVIILCRWQECFYRYHVLTLLSGIRGEWFIIYYSDSEDMQMNNTIAMIDLVLSLSDLKQEYE